MYAKCHTECVDARGMCAKLRTGEVDAGEQALGIRDQAIGEGIEAFEFADGTTYTLEQILQQADVVVSVDYLVERDSGAQELGAAAGYNAIRFADGISSSEVAITHDGVDLLLSLTDSTASVRVVGQDLEDALVHGRRALVGEQLDLQHPRSLAQELELFWQALRGLARDGEQPIDGLPFASSGVPLSGSRNQVQELVVREVSAA